MQLKQSNNEQQSPVLKKKNRQPAVPTVYDFKQFMGYAGQFGRDALDSWPTATD